MKISSSIGIFLINSSRAIIGETIDGCRFFFRRIVLAITKKKKRNRRHDVSRRCAKHIRYSPRNNGNNSNDDVRSLYTAEPSEIRMSKSATCTEFRFPHRSRIPRSARASFSRFFVPSIAVSRCHGVISPGAQSSNTRDYLKTILYSV